MIDPATVTATPTEVEVTAQKNWLEATINVATFEDAEAFCTEFPKYVKAHACTLSGNHDGDYFKIGMVRVAINLQTNGVNGGVNEMGIKRYRAFRRICEAKGLPFKFVEGFYRLTESELDELLEASDPATRA